MFPGKGLILFSVIFLSRALDPAAAEGEGAVSPGAGGLEDEAPLVMVGILARNTAHTLPNFLGYLERLDYPKHRMAVW